MAARKILESPSDSQGLIKYLSEASQVSRDNVFLRELGNTANFKREMVKLVEFWIVAQARTMLVQWIEGYQKTHVAAPSPAAPKKALASRAPRYLEIGEFQSFFRTQAESATVRKAQTVSQRNRWALYFKKWGCLLCQKRHLPHASNGMCKLCHDRIYERLRSLSF